MVEKASRIVKNVAVDLSKRDDGLEWVAQRVLDGDQACDHVGERTPAYLIGHICQLFMNQYGKACRLTAVMDSMQSTNAFCVRYRESERAYSFHS